MIRILIAGLGSIGRRHLRNLQNLGINDILLLRTKDEPLEEAKELTVFTKLDEALRCEPDVVVISTPSAFHLDVALPAANAGCNLFIEKPLSNSWDGVEELLATVKRRKLTTLAGFDLRFDPGLRKAKTIIDEGRIGRVLAIQVQVGQYLPEWRPHQDYRVGVSAQVATGGGVTFDLVHELDYVCWLVGPVKSTVCFADHVSSLEIETEDVAAILLKFENGAIGTVHLDYVQRVPSRTCRIIGAEGTILWDYFSNNLKWYEAAGSCWQEFNYAGFERNDRFLQEMRHLLACVEGSEQPVVDLFAASRTLKLALAIKESALSGKACQVGFGAVQT
jgi:predicted dehydrogenase